MADIISKETVEHVAKLAKIPVSEKERDELTSGFNQVLTVVDELFAADVSSIQPTHQVTGLDNVFREDRIDTIRMFSQEAALSNAPKKHRGYFVVDRILNIEF